MAIQFSLVSLVLAITKIEFYVLPDNCDYLIDGLNRPGWRKRLRIVTNKEGSKQGLN